MKKSVIVAAANSGIGLSLVREMLLENVYEIHSTYRSNDSALIKLYEESDLDPDHYTHQIDLSDGTEVFELFNRIADVSNMWGVVNFAGVVAARRLSKMTWEEASELFLGNSLSALATTQAALKIFSARATEGGRIVQTSSVIARRPVPGVVPYAAGKSAIEGVVRSAAVEAGTLGVTVNAIRLGYFNMGMTTHVPEAIVNDVIRSTSARRLGEVEDLAQLVNYLLSEKSIFMTGKVLDLDGGLV